MSSNNDHHPAHSPDGTPYSPKGLVDHVNTAQGNLKDISREVSGSLSVHATSVEQLLEMVESDIVDNDRLTDANRRLRAEVAALKTRCLELEQRSHGDAARPDGDAEAPVVERPPTDTTACVLEALAHELIAPMRTVTESVTSLQSTSLSKDQKKTLAQTSTSLRILRTMLDTVLDLPSILSGDLELDVELIDLALVVNDVIETLSPIAAAKGLTLSVQFDPAVPQRVAGDGRRLHQVLLYVVMQSIRFAEHDDIAIRIAVQDVSCADQLVQFSVVNDGRGISEERLETILDRPRLTADATTAPDRDVQIGLLAVKHVTGLMGGTFNVRGGSKGGFGLEFSAVLAEPSTIGEERRVVKGRILQQMLQSNLGPVIDLSAGGARILTRRVPRRTADVWLFEHNGSVQVKAKAVWSRPLGNQTHEVGFRFVKLDDETARSLRRIANQHGLLKVA